MNVAMYVPDTSKVSQIVNFLDCAMYDLPMNEAINTVIRALY